MLNVDFIFPGALNHLAMVTQDMDMTIRFWRDLLGMRLVAGLGRPGHWPEPSKPTPQSGRKIYHGEGMTLVEHEQ